MPPMTTAADARRGTLPSQFSRCVWCGAVARPTGPVSRLAICGACGTATTYPPPDNAELEAAYADWYRPSEGRFSAGGDAVLRRSRGILARRLDRRAPAGPVLDVGSGDGALLDALHARGREAVGLERKTSRSDVRERDVVDFDERVGGWAAIVFWHSLEHLRDPAAAVDRALTLLAPGGLLVIAVPNRASWQARALGPRWLALDLPRHLVHLTARALIDGLEQRGFALERVSYWRGGQVVFGWLHGLVVGLPGHPDLYDTLRRAAARRSALTSPARRRALVGAVALFPAAAALSGLEVAARAGGSVYVEARAR